MGGLIKRGKGTFHFRMRVPKEYVGVAGKTEIHRTLKTDSARKAAELVPAMRKSVLDELKALKLLHDEPNSANAYRAAQEIVKKHGLNYMPSDALLLAPLEKTLVRFEKLAEGDNIQVARALLGGIKEPGLRLTGLVATVEEYRGHDNRHKNDDQLRKWRNPRKKAVRNLMKSIGNKDILISEIDAAAVQKHKMLWQKAVSTGKTKPDTANKDFIYMRSMLSDYYESIGMAESPRPYQGIGIKKDRYEKPNRKLEIPVSWMTEKWLSPGALDGINQEAIDILLISIETGCRQSEISNLPPHAIVLDDPIPHLNIQVEEGDMCREVKNTASQRQVPLVGVALAAAKRHPEGFPTYRGNSNYSNTINKALREKGLLPSEKHTVGGTRHAFESRLKKVQLPNDDRGELMGHSVKSIRDRELYGDDMTLADKLALHNLIVLPVPKHLE
ncbi:DUF6538 domain-containing protein [Cohaesibacter intestini]|uniref:DUF6538 domain-containing protein n=1 Tax=Cohaesibacter intestini TaxID=2211145 RepID=UPI000DEA0495|nr:DUF6538 domain-containing protein [Cohaesibacter intestini]